jgi:hypothetical protein
MSTIVHSRQLKRKSQELKTVCWVCLVFRFCQNIQGHKQLLLIVLQSSPMKHPFALYRSARSHTAWSHHATRLAHEAGFRKAFARCTHLATYCVRRLHIGALTVCAQDYSGQLRAGIKFSDSYLEGSLLHKISRVSSDPEGFEG